MWMLPGSLLLDCLCLSVQSVGTQSGIQVPSVPGTSSMGAWGAAMMSHYFAPARGEAPFRMRALCSSWLVGSSCGQRIRGCKYSRTALETGLVMRSLMFSFVGQYTGRTIPVSYTHLTLPTTPYV